MADDRPPEDARGGVIPLLEQIGAVVVPLGVGLYALLYMGIEEMYAVFNVSPQQVGIDQSVLFSRLITTLVLLVLVLIPLVGMIVAAAWAVNKITFGRAARALDTVRRRPWTAAFLAALWCGATYAGAAAVFSPFDALGMAAVAGALALVAFLVPFRLLRRRQMGRAGVKVVTGTLTGIGLGFVLILEMIKGAAGIQATGQGNTFLDFLGFQDQWVVLKDADTDRPLYNGRWMMLLGESVGTYVFYDCDKLETFRRPIEGTHLAHMQLQPEREEGYTCGGLAGPETVD
ncbi:hypothetical protein Ssi02_23910 [Sinosporangium siamense]|uniref:Uncharacterized protein n=1 Tax=Sinosporangium siamense TaxID=1367973 RepID=A0A919V4Q1_9ACTN|nr:hypothetical protein Ssi02_23910 [Sinosporangium siamense]